MTLLFLTLATPALAVDGVLEINQTCAVQTGCFAGDTPGFPVTINGSAGRSYKLTSDLGGVIGLNADVIRITADYITIDLSGFRVICTTFTPPSTVQLCSKSGSGSGSGISVDDSFIRSGVEIMNGSVVGMPGRGVFLGIRSIARNLRVSQNAGDGIVVNEGSIVSGSSVTGSGTSGILTGPGAIVSNNNVQGNGTSGFGFGLFLGIDTGYHDNVIRSNEEGPVFGGTNGGGNVCNGSLTCP